MNPLTVQHPEEEEEREIFDIDRSDRKQVCKTKKIKVSVFDMIINCFKGRGYVEVEVDTQEDAFKDNKAAVAMVDVKPEDI